VELAFSPARFFEPIARRRMGGDLSHPASPINQARRCPAERFWRKRANFWLRLSSKLTRAPADHFHIARMPAHCFPNQSEPVAFTCPSCEAEYKIVAIEGPSDAQRNKIGCLRCDALFPAGEGRVFYKYLLVGSGKAKRR